MQNQYFRPLCIASLLLAVPCGCSPSNPMNRQAISGKVAFDGAPLDHGTIEFSPHRQQGGIGSGALIDNGRYAILAKKGLPPGEYLVRLFSVEKSADSFSGEPGPGIGKPGKDRIPMRYNVHSDIVVEVTDSGPNKFDFDVIAINR